MPLTRIYQPKPALNIAFWEITENPEQLLGFTELSSKEREWVSQCHPNRQCEILAVRALLSQVLNTDYQGIVYNELGKPNLVGLDLALSISHSKKQVAVALCESLQVNQQLGIDLEFFSERISRLQQKFMSEQELAFCGNDLVKKTLVWSAKESLFKWYHKKEVDFRKHLLVSDFVLSKHGNFVAQIRKEPLLRTFNVGYLVLEKMVLTFVDGKMDTQY